MNNQYEETLHKSIESCLQKTFMCGNFVKHECIVAFEEIQWKGYTIDIVGYSESTKSLYIVEAKNETWLGSSGIASAIGQIIVYMASFLKEKETIDSIRKYANIEGKEIKNAYFYIALPNFSDKDIYKRIYPLCLRVLREIYQILSGRFGVLQIEDLNKPANIVEEFVASPIYMK